jgi:hypothetical protein
MWRWFIEMHDEPFSYVNETLEEDRKLTALETYSPCPCAFQGALLHIYYRRHVLQRMTPKSEVMVRPSD